MTPRAALLPNEAHCPRCGGEGVVPGEEGYVSSWATTPRSIGMVECPAGCASGVVTNESRDASRPGGEIAAEFVRLRNAVAFERAIANSLRDEIERLRAENRRYREAIDKAARVIVSLAARGSVGSVTT